MAAVREPTDLVSSPPNQKRHSGRVHDFGHTGNPKPPEQSKTYRTIPLKPPTPRFFRIPDFCSPQHTSQYMCVFLLKSGKPTPSKLVRYAKTQWPKIRTFGTPRKFSSYVSSVFHHVFPSFPSFFPKFGRSPHFRNATARPRGMRRALGTLAACVALWRPWSLGRGRAGVPQHLSWGAWYGIPNIGYTIYVYSYVFIYLLSIYLFLLAYIYIYYLFPL